MVRKYWPSENTKRRLSRGRHSSEQQWVDTIETSHEGPPAGAHNSSICTKETFIGYRSVGRIPCLDVFGLKLRSTGLQGCQDRRYESNLNRNVLSHGYRICALDRIRGDAHRMAYHLDKFRLFLFIPGHSRKEAKIVGALERVP